MLPLEIEILWHTDETKAEEINGKDADLSRFETRTFTFYHIDCILPYKWEKDILLCKIYSGHEQWLTAHSYEEVKEMIEKNNPIN